jgi:hypothetical protein
MSGHRRDIDMPSSLLDRADGTPAITDYVIECLKQIIARVETNLAGSSSPRWLTPA